jgi:putative Holliday junction resolvase
MLDAGADVVPPVDQAAPKGTVLALDYGERFVGIAVGETAMRVAHPLATLDEADAEARLEAIAEFVAEWRPVQLVVGLPLNMDGTAHAVTRKARRFARRLEERFALPVALVDERLSSAEAEERLRGLGRGGRKDKHFAHSVAAQVILQDWLDAGTGDAASRR